MGYFILGLIILYLIVIIVDMKEKGYQIPKYKPTFDDDKEDTDK